MEEKALPCAFHFQQGLDMANRRDRMFWDQVAEEGNQMKRSRKESDAMQMGRRKWYIEKMERKTFQNSALS